MKQHRGEGRFQQLSLDMGQDLAAKSCPQCRMIYHNVDEDLKLHAKVCPRAPGAARRTPGVSNAEELGKLLLNITAATRSQLSELTLVTTKTSALSIPIVDQLNALLCQRRPQGEVAGEYSVPQCPTDWSRFAAVPMATFAIHQTRCEAFVIWAQSESIHAVGHAIATKDESLDAGSSPVSREGSPDPTPESEEPSPTYRVVKAQAAIVDIWIAKPRAQKSLVAMFQPKLEPNRETRAFELVGTLCDYVRKNAVYGCELSFDQISFSFHLGDPAAPDGELTNKAIRTAIAAFAAQWAPLWSSPQ